MAIEAVLSPSHGCCQVLHASVSDYNDSKEKRLLAQSQRRMLTLVATEGSQASPVSAGSPQVLPKIAFHRSHSCTIASQTIAEDCDSEPPPLPPRPQPQSPLPSPSLTFKLCVHQSGQRLKKIIGACKSLPPTSKGGEVQSPTRTPVASKCARRLSLPAAGIHQAKLPRPPTARCGSDASLTTHPFGHRALPSLPTDNPTTPAAAGLAQSAAAAGGAFRARSTSAPIRVERIRRRTERRSPRPASLSSTSESDLSPRIMAAPPIAPRPAHTLTEKSSSSSSGYSSRGQSPAHRQSSAPTSDIITPDTPRRLFKESISLPISQTSSSDHMSPTATAAARGRRGSQDSGTLSLDQSPTGGGSGSGHKGVKAGLRRMVGSLKQRSATTPKKRLAPDACLSPPTPDMTVNCAWPAAATAMMSPSGMHSQPSPSDEALLRAHRSSCGGHVPLHRCSATGSAGGAGGGVRSPGLHHPHSNSQHHAEAIANGVARRDLQIIGRAHSLPAHSVHALLPHQHSQANRQLSSGHLDHGHAAMVRKGFDYNAKYRAFDWFFGRMSRERAHRLLSEHGRAGNFLLRERDTCPGEYAISVKVPQTVLHFRVYNDDHGYVCNKDAGACPTLIDLVRYHTTVPLTGNGSGSGDVFYLERALNRSLIPASEGLPSVTRSSSSLAGAGSSTISRQDSSDLQDINEELYLEPLPCSMTPSDSEASKGGDEDDDVNDEVTIRLRDDGVYIDENTDVTERESTA